MLENFLTITSPPILLSAARRKNCLCFKLPYIGPFSVETQPKIKKLVSTPSLTLRVGLGSRILSLRVYDRELFISFHEQAVVPVMSVKPTDTSPLASPNISPVTNIPTFLSTWEVLKIVAPFLKFWTLLPQASNWKLPWSHAHLLGAAVFKFAGRTS